MRLVFTHCTPEFVEAARHAFPEATFKPGRHPTSSPALYVAHAPEHVAEYDAWFRGVAVRARGKAVPRGGGVYLPVTYNSWLVVVDGVEGFGAALEAAKLLKGVRTVVCPAFEDVDAAVASSERSYDRWQDRLCPVNAVKGPLTTTAEGVAAEDA